MDAKKLQELLKLLEKHSNIAELSVEEKSFKFHVKFKGSEAPQVFHSSPMMMGTMPSVQHAPQGVSAGVSEKPASTPSSDVKHIKSPMVGSFYSKASPDAKPFVKVGDTVKIGTVVCIVESMKIFNEVESEIQGVIKEVLLKDGTPVEHGQPLFVVE